MIVFLRGGRSFCTKAVSDVAKADVSELTVWNDRSLLSRYALIPCRAATSSVLTFLVEKLSHSLHVFQQFFCSWLQCLLHPRRALRSQPERRIGESRMRFVVKLHLFVEPVCYGRVRTLDVLAASAMSELHTVYTVRACTPVPCPASRNFECVGKNRWSTNDYDDRLQ